MLATLHRGVAHHSVDDGTQNSGCLATVGLTDATDDSRERLAQHIDASIRSVRIGHEGSVIQNLSKLEAVLHETNTVVLTPALQRLPHRAGRRADETTALAIRPDVDP